MVGGAVSARTQIEAVLRSEAQRLLAEEHGHAIIPPPRRNGGDLDRGLQDPTLGVQGEPVPVRGQVQRERRVEAA